MDINRRKLFKPKQNKEIIVKSYPYSIISEQFRTIQANIKFLMTDQKHRTFLITSPSDGEGKSTLAINLAVSMAQQKKKVLLIDANLRKPSLHLFFKTPNSNGLTSVLSGKLSLEETVYHTDIWRLDFLSSGLIPNNPVELLGSQMMQDLLNRTSKFYDTIIIDSYEVLEVTETKLLANLCDAVIMVLKSNKTTQEKATDAKKALEFAQAKIVGVVLNH